MKVEVDCPSEVRRRHSAVAALVGLSVVALVASFRLVASIIVFTLLRLGRCFFGGPHLCGK